MKRYTRALLGPSLFAPFRVTAGTVVVHLARSRSIVIPAGGGWPGLHPLPTELAVSLAPKRTSCLPGTHTEPDDEAGRPAALALVLAQALTAVGTLSERLRLAEALGMPLRSINQTTAGLVIGTTRESFGREIDT